MDRKKITNGITIFCAGFMFFAATIHFEEELPHIHQGAYFHKNVNPSYEAVISASTMNTYDVKTHWANIKQNTVGRLYSIPDAHVSECLVASEMDCGQCPSNETKKEEKPMVKIMDGFKKGITKSSFVIIIIMSILHIGIAYIHSRESGRVDFIFFVTPIFSHRLMKL